MKKVIHLIIFIICFFILCPFTIYAEGVDDKPYYMINDKNSDATFTIEEIAGRRLYVYNLISGFDDESIILDSDEPLSRLDMSKLLFSFLRNDNTLIRDLTCDTGFEDVPLEYLESVNFLFMNNLVTGVSETKFGVSDCDRESFCYILLKYMGINIEYDKINIIEISKELGLLNYVNFDNKVFTRGEAYLILSNLLDLKKEDRTYKDIIVGNIEYREEMSLPYKINIYVNSFDDFKSKFDYAYSLAPKRVFVNFTDSCNNEEILKIYDYILKDEYSWKGVLDDFYNVNYVYSYSKGQFIIHYNNILNTDKSATTESLREECKIIYSEINDMVDNQEIEEDYGNYLKEIRIFDKVADKKQIEIVIFSYNDWVYTNLELLDWVKCYNRVTDGFIENAQKHLKEMDNYKELSDYEKLLNVHRYICNHASYDYKEVNRMKYLDDIDNFDLADAHDAIGFIRDGKIVCDGYAYTYQWLLDYLGIDCIVVYGDSTLRGKPEGHAWNKVKLDGKWYNVDVCWADTSDGMSYFLKSDDYYDKNFHKIDEYFNIESLLSKENYSKY